MCILLLVQWSIVCTLLLLFLLAFRVMVAWQPVGLAMGVYDVCVRYVQQREQFGTQLGAFQLVQERLVRMAANIQVQQGR